MLTAEQIDKIVNKNIEDVEVEVMSNPTYKEANKKALDSFDKLKRVLSNKEIKLVMQFEDALMKGFIITTEGTYRKGLEDGMNFIHKDCVI